MRLVAGHVASFALVLALGACGRDAAPRADSASLSPTGGATAGESSAPGAGAATGALKPACERTGHWIPCQVRDRLDRSGFVLRDSVPEEALPSLGPKPVFFRVDKAGLAIYLFADSTARRLASARLDTTLYVAQTSPLTMVSKGTVIQNDNLLALLFGKNEHQRERVSDAITAGPPQR